MAWNLDLARFADIVADAVRAPRCTTRGDMSNIRW
jgi:hypothetical protein